MLQNRGNKILEGASFCGNGMREIGEMRKYISERGVFLGRELD